MEFVIAIIIFLVISAWLSEAKKDSKSKKGNKAKEGNKTKAGKKKPYLGPPQLKFVNATFKGKQVKKIMFRGKLPNDQDMNISFALSAIDVTEGKEGINPVLSLIDAFQEKTTSCYGISDDFGFVEEGSFIADWARVGDIFPELIQPPYSGEREIAIILRMFNSEDPPTIWAGMLEDDDDEPILSKTLSFKHHFTSKGYKEEAKDKEESQVIALKIGVAVAMADGSLDDREGEVLKNWIIKEVSVFSDSRQKELKNIFNKALKEGYAEANNENLSNLVNRLAEIGDEKSKYDAVELCLEVMAADGEAHPKEMSVIRNMAKDLGLDIDELEKMREKVTLDISTELTSEEGLEALVGIDPAWSNDQKCKHLRLEFQKWSNRINSLPEGEERAASQSMLDNIATLRKNYDC